MPEQGAKLHYFQILMDRTKTNALARGAVSPGWQDVWTAMAEIPETASVFAERGIDTRNFVTELSFMTRFRPAQLDFDTAYTRAEILQAVTELQESVRTLNIGSTAGENDGTYLAESSVIRRIAFSLQSELLAAEDLDAATRRMLLKGAILEHVTLNTFGSIQGNDAAVTKILDKITPILKQTLEKQLNALPFAGLPPVDVSEALEGMIAQRGLLPTPNDIFEFVLEHSEPVYTDLLYRNGLRSIHPDRADPLEGKLPSLFVQRAMNDALRLAYTGNARALSPRHIALTLLREGSVLQHLSRAGIKDLGVFAEKFRAATLPEDAESRLQSRVSVHAAIPPAMADLTGRLDAAYRDTGRPEGVFAALLAADRDLAKAASKAGLTRAMLRDWASHYEKPEDKTAKKKGDDYAQKPVSDHELNALIEEYCTDYTALAAQKKFDPMIGNEALITQMSTILLKRGKKNPVAIGEPGVGKTKVLEGMAQAIVAGKVPQKLVGARLLMLDLHRMNDSPYIGMFESKLKPLLTGIAQRNAEGKNPPILLGIDEFAEAQDAGAHSKSPGFRGMVKPYLTTGDIFLLGATTNDEYRSKIEKDPAMARRLQPVFIQTPTDDEATQILKGLKSRFERYHGVTASPAMLGAVARMAGRYIHTVNQPDKSIDLLDESMAEAQASGAKSLKKEHVIKVVAGKTGIPESHLSENSNARYAKLEERLKERVLGQDPAVAVVASALKRAKAGFKNPSAPIGNFLFVGPTGVGKTELTKALAEFIMGHEEEFLVRFDMSEYQEKQSVARFIGAPPGYVGYEEGGGLVKTVRSKPFAVYLYDEVEKAHPDVFNALLAPFSDGVLTDGRGVKADMRDTINIMTSNIGAEEVMAEGERRGLDPIRDYEAWQKMSRPIYERAVQRFFRPEFLNRLDGIVYFESLKPSTIEMLVSRQASQTARQLEAGYGLKLNLPDEFRKAASAQGFDVRYGARPLKRAWAEAVETPLADWLLRQKPGSLKRASSVTAETAAPGSGKPRFTLTFG